MIDVKQEKYGFSYGTLPDHAESGQESFQVEWNHFDNSVWYDLKRFAVDSKKAMWEADVL